MEFSVIHLKKAIVVIGPTASGKSLFAIDLAHSINGEIISADAFQVYKDFNIGTGKISTHHMQGISHHLLSTQCPQIPYSVHQFLEDTKSAMVQINTNKKIPIICGGSAMYLKALLYGYQPLKRLPLEQIPDGSKESLWERLHTIDPDLANRTPLQNKRRVQRYLELYQIYDVPPSTLFKQSKFDHRKYKVFGLYIEKSNLKEKINARVDQMISDGLIDEVRTLMKQYKLSSSPFQGIGYKEVIEYINGGISKEDMIELIKRNTIHYAKKQMTWFKAFNNVTWIY